MDWHVIWTSLATSLGGTAVLLAAAAFLAKRWIGVRIDESVKHEYARRLKDDTDQRAADTALLRQLLEVLPSSGNIRDFRHWEGAGPFGPENVGQLEAFQRHWGDPEHEFLDADLERMRRELYDRATQYLDLLKGTDLLAMMEAWEGPERDAWIRKVSDLCSQVAEAHERLVKTARAKLKR